jgi:hypothetical protein
MDAKGANDEAPDAFDEAVWSWHPDAGVKFRWGFPRGDGG